MTAPRAFSATYSDWKLIRTRGVVQVVLEVPLHAADIAYAVLGGMPNAAKEIWCDVQKHDARPEPAKRTGDRRSWDQYGPSQQAGIWSNDEHFWKFLNSTGIAKRIVKSVDGAAAAIREYCGVTSRADIKPDNQQWLDLVFQYREWCRSEQQ